MSRLEGAGGVLGARCHGPDVPCLPSPAGHRALSPRLPLAPAPPVQECTVLRIAAPSRLPLLLPRCMQVHSLLNVVRPDRQTLLFSATLPRRIETLVAEALSNPVRISVGLLGAANADVMQRVEILPGGLGRGQGWQGVRVWVWRSVRPNPEPSISMA